MSREKKKESNPFEDFEDEPIDLTRATGATGSERPASGSRNPPPLPVPQRTTPGVKRKIEDQEQKQSEEGVAVDLGSPGKRAKTASGGKEEKEKGKEEKKKKAPRLPPTQTLNRQHLGYRQLPKTGNAVVLAVDHAWFNPITGEIVSDSAVSKEQRSSVEQTHRRVFRMGESEAAEDVFEVIREPQNSTFCGINTGEWECTEMTEREIVARLVPSRAEFNAILSKSGKGRPDFVNMDPRENAAVHKRLGEKFKGWLPCFHPNMLYIVRRRLLDTGERPSAIATVQDDIKMAKNILESLREEDQRTKKVKEQREEAERKLTRAEARLQGLKDPRAAGMTHASPKGYGDALSCFMDPGDNDTDIQFVVCFKSHRIIKKPEDPAPKLVGTRTWCLIQDPTVLLHIHAIVHTNPALKFAGAKSGTEANEYRTWMPIPTLCQVLAQPVTSGGLYWQIQNEQFLQQYEGDKKTLYKSMEWDSWGWTANQKDRKLWSDQRSPYPVASAIGPLVTLIARTAGIAHREQYEFTEIETSVPVEAGADEKVQPGVATAEAVAGGESLELREFREPWELDEKELAALSPEKRAEIEEQRLQALHNRGIRAIKENLEGAAVEGIGLLQSDAKDVQKWLLDEQFTIETALYESWVASEGVMEAHPPFAVFSPMLDPAQPPASDVLVGLLGFQTTTVAERCQAASRSVLFSMWHLMRDVTSLVHEFLREYERELVIVGLAQANNGAVAWPIQPLAAVGRLREFHDTRVRRPDDANSVGGRLAAFFDTALKWIAEEKERNRFWIRQDVYSLVGSFDFEAGQSRDERYDYHSLLGLDHTDWMDAYAASQVTPLIQALSGGNAFDNDWIQDEIVATDMRDRAREFMTLAFNNVQLKRLAAHWAAALQIPDDTEALAAASECEIELLLPEKRPAKDLATSAKHKEVFDSVPRSGQEHIQIRVSWTRAIADQKINEARRHEIQAMQWLRKHYPFTQRYGPSLSATRQESKRRLEELRQGALGQQLVLAESDLEVRGDHLIQATTMGGVFRSNDVEKQRIAFRLGYLKQIRERVKEYLNGWFKFLLPVWQTAIYCSDWRPAGAELDNIRALGAQLLMRLTDEPLVERQSQVLVVPPSDVPDVKIGGQIKNANTEACASDIWTLSTGLKQLMQREMKRWDDEARNEEERQAAFERDEKKRAKKAKKHETKQTREAKEQEAQEAAQRRRQRRREREDAERRAEERKDARAVFTERIQDKHWQFDAYEVALRVLGQLHRDDLRDRLLQVRAALAYVTEIHEIYRTARSNIVDRKFPTAWPRAVNARIEQHQSRVLHRQVVSDWKAAEALPKPSQQELDEQGDDEEEDDDNDDEIFKPLTKLQKKKDRQVAAVHQLYDRATSYWSAAADILSVNDMLAEELQRFQDEGEDSAVAAARLARLDTMVRDDILRPGDAQLRGDEKLNAAIETNRALARNELLPHLLLTPLRSTVNHREGDPRHAAQDRRAWTLHLQFWMYALARHHLTLYERVQSLIAIDDPVLARIFDLAVRLQYVALLSSTDDQAYWMLRRGELPPEDRKAVGRVINGSFGKIVYPEDFARALEKRLEASDRARAEQEVAGMRAGVSLEPGGMAGSDFAQLTEEEKAAVRAQKAKDKAEAEAKREKKRAPPSGKDEKTEPTEEEEEEVVMASGVVPMATTTASASEGGGGSLVVPSDGSGEEGTNEDDDAALLNREDSVKKRKREQGKP